MTTEQQIDILYSNHKTQFTWVIVIVILIILFGVFEYFYGPSTKVMFSDDKITKALADSIRIHDKQRTIEFQQLQLIHQQDSVRIDNLEDDLSTTQTMINILNNKYAKERTTLINSSLDTRINFLSNHLPKSSSN